MHILLLVLAGLAGVAVGAIGHAYLAKEAAVTKSELALWSQRLRATFDADITTAKARVQTLVDDIEKKL